MKILKTLFKLVILPVGLVVFTFLVINAIDRKADPAVEQLAQVVTENIAPEENAYFSILGLYAPEGADILEAGITVVNQANTRLSTPRRGTNQLTDLNTLLGDKRLAFKGNTKNLCTQGEAKCLPVFVEHIGELRTMLEENRVLVNRYYTLFNYPAFREDLIQTIFTPKTNLADEVSTLAFAEAGLLASLARINEALQILEQDTTLWRRVLAGAQLAESKLAAAKRIQRNVALASEIILENDKEQVDQELIHKILSPLPAKAGDFSNHVRLSFSRERNALLRLFHDIQVSEIVSDWQDDHLANWWKRVYRPRATVNLRAPEYQALLPIAGQPATALEQQCQTAAQQGNRQSTEADWSYLYNGLGKTLAAKLAGNSAAQLCRQKGVIYNTQGFMNLVALQMRIKYKDISQTQVEAYLTQIRGEFGNPYTGQQMSRDAVNHKLYFMGTTEKPAGELLSRRIEVPYVTRF